MLDLSSIMYAIVFDALNTALSSVTNFDEWKKVRKEFQQHQYPNDIRLSINEMLMHSWRNLRATNHKVVVKPNVAMRNNMDFIFAYRVE